MLPLTHTTRPRSRIHGPRRIERELHRLRKRQGVLLQDLARVLIKSTRAAEYREFTEDEQRWLRHVHQLMAEALTLSRDIDARLERVLCAAAAVLTSEMSDPRVQRGRKS